VGTDTAPRPLLTAREVGAFIGVSTKTVRRWEREGRLPAVRVTAHTVRFRRSDVEALTDPPEREGAHAR